MYELKKIIIIILIMTHYFYGSPGDPDCSFGPMKTGMVITPLNRSACINDMQMDNDNNIIIVGSTTAHLQGSFIARYTPEGIPDISFNGSGFKEIFIKSCVWHSIAILPNNNILVGGSVQDAQTKCAFATFSQAGIFAPTFESATEIFTQKINDADCIRSLAITKSGAIIAAGTSIRGLPVGLILKYLPTGDLDTSFGDYGIVQTPFTALSTINKITIQPSDEKIIAIGYVEKEASIHFALARYLPNGKPDLTFGTNGFVSTRIEYYANALDIVLQPNGCIIAAGFTFDYETLAYKFVAVRYDPQGNLDLSFNNTGIIVTPIAYSAEAHAIAIQSDGKIILGGTSQGSRNIEFTLMRYNIDGSTDESFGEKGLVTGRINKKCAGITRMIIQNTTLLTAGYANNDIVLARYLL